MKYKNEKTRKLLKEFRKFCKWSPKGIYSFNGNEQEEFNKNIKSIVEENENE